jgi:cytochrome c oxidase subunit 2
MERFLAQYMPLDASAHGQQLDRLNAMVHWLMLILFVGWGLYFVYALMRFRKTKNPRASYDGAQTHLSTYSEAGVAIVEVILLVAFSIPAWYQYTKRPPAESHPLEIRLVAEQFAWNLQYTGPDGVFGTTRSELVSSTNPMGLDPADPHGKDDIITVNQLHLQLNRPTIIRLSSKDVIHSFNLPVMRVKQDAIPGMEVPVHFTPVKANNAEMRWEIACAQLCGLGHFRMRGQMNVDTKADFEKWMRENAPSRPAGS